MVENASCPSAAEIWGESADRKDLSRNRQERGPVYAKFMDDFYKAIDGELKAGKPLTSGDEVNLIQSAYNTAAQNNSEGLAAIGASASLVFSSKKGDVQREIVSFQADRTSTTVDTKNNTLLRKASLAYDSKFSEDPTIGEILNGTNGSAFSLALRFDQWEHGTKDIPLIVNAASGVEFTDPINNIVSENDQSKMTPVPVLIAECNKP
jgi:hypothetical protein